MSATHTPGPWTYHFDEPAREWALVMSGGMAGAIVANVNTKSCPDIQSAPSFRVMPAEANARLIAAAPELLEALTRLRRFCINEVHGMSEYGIGAEQMRAARQAITNAGGAS